MINNEENLFNDVAMKDLLAMVDPSETIYWKGKPDKKCFRLESIFNPLLPFAAIWGLIDFSILGVSLFSGEAAFFIIPFILFHMMPVWMYLGGILLITRKYKNMAYIVTDKAVYFSHGAFTKNVNVKPFAELSHINLHRGIIDQMCNVGDVVISTNQYTSKGAPVNLVISSISDYQKVYSMVSKLQKDIHSDVQYPNAYRPDSNPGYNTKYTNM